jgi:hypothetical protein
MVVIHMVKKMMKCIATTAASSGAAHFGILRLWPAEKFVNIAELGSGAAVAGALYGGLIGMRRFS